MKVLSLFDGMACGMLAMLQQGIPVERYVAYEIDKYAIKTSQHNFPMIEHRGDVFEADFTEFEGFDYLIGGSPCTYWSIAQKNNRETEASGMGWELFQQYVRALKEAKPKYFVYENNKSMSKAIRQSIDDAFGFEAVLINSALVSAQNRQRLYWVGRRNDDGTYSKVNVEQPQDRGILLRDILECGHDLTSNDKGYCLTASYNGACAWNTIERKQRTIVAKPVNTTNDGKSHTLKAQYYKNGTANFITNGGFGASAVAEPVRIPEYGNEDKSRPLNALYPNNCGGFEHRMWSDKPNKQQVDMIAEPIRVGSMPQGNGELSTAQSARIYSVDGKSTTINAGGGGAGAKTGLYAVPCELDEDGKPVKAMSYADGKTYQVYEVKDGFITIKGKQYPIKLKDGYYIIRKLTVRECMRLQTVPEWYAFPVSDSQAYKMLGNGWTVDVIAHILSYTN